ncbi:MAG: hypothetical protein HY047_15405, partial [Acidobacteria bacterium]|nr:hypothetical protein [Acidobacteriota bacterium]
MNLRGRCSRGRPPHPHVHFGIASGPRRRGRNRAHVRFRAAREASTSKAAARAALRGALGAIIRTARGLALDTPGLHNGFRRPFTCAGQALCIAGRAFVQDARPLAAEFVEYGLPPTFLRDLDTAIQRFEAAIREHAAGIGTRIAARTAVGAA